MAREGFDGGPVCTSRNTLGEERVSMATPAAGWARKSRSNDVWQIEFVGDSVS
jgi:hypothetical protein